MKKKKKNLKKILIHFIKIQLMKNINLNIPINKNKKMSYHNLIKNGMALAIITMDNWEI